MSTLTELVRSYAVLEESTVAESYIPSQIATRLAAKECKLIEVVKELGEALLSEVDTVRSRGVRLLSAVVGAIDTQLLDRQSTKTLTTFFTDKLSDASSMPACVAALTHLTESPAFGVGEGIEVTRGIFASITLTSYPQSTRFIVYTLLDSLMSRCRPALKRLGKEFVSGYCALVEGEKDPRNLMLSFSMARVILVEFDITETVTDLFDITFCYFPITFTPPPDDPYGITSDELVEALRNCLAATPLFGPLALNLFLEKMQAASEKAKRQTLQALTACFPIYGAAESGEWAGRFSEALSIEIFHATDDETMELALTCFQSLFATLYPDVPPSAVTEHGSHGDDSEAMVVDAPSMEIKGVGVKVVANSLEELQEPDKSNAKPAVRILTALINSSNRLAQYIISLTLPQLYSLYKNPDEVGLRAAILSHLSTILGSLSTAPAAPSSALAPTPAFTPPHLSHANGASPLEPFRDDLLSILTSGTRSPSSRPAALEGLVNLVKVDNFLSPAEVAFSVSAINDVLLQPESDEQYDAALDGLVAISKMHPRVIEASTLPILFTALPSEAPKVGTKANEAYRRALESLAALCVHPSLFEILSLRLLARLETISASAPDDEQDRSRAALYAHHMLATLRAVLRAKAAAGHDDIAKYLDKFVPRLYGLFILPTLSFMDQNVVAKDPRLLVDAGQVITLVAQKVDVERQSTFSDALNTAFHDGVLGPLLGEQAKEAGELPFQPLKDEGSDAQKDTVVLFSAAVLTMRPTVAVTAADLTVFLRLFLVRSVSAKNETQLGATLHLLGQTVNKRAPDLEGFLSEDIPKYWEENVVAPKPDATRKAALRAWAWIAKGLVVRSDQRGYEAVGKIVDLLSDPVLGLDAAAALGVIADESDRVLSKDNFAVIRLLYKQRFFGLLLPKLVAGHKAAEVANQGVFLVALSFLLLHIPRQIALTELPKLLPLLITALDLPDLSLRANVIDTLGILAKEVPIDMDNSISGIALKVLRDVVDGTNAKGAVKLRLAALAFLGILPEHIPYPTLHPQKALVLRQLGKAIDDPRRDVRRAAVECRSRWFLFSGAL